MQRNKTEQKFLAQSYQDAWSDYATALSTPKAPRWDWIVLTAADETQAAAYQMQLDRRGRENSLVPDTRYIVVPDTGGVRIGSGGATLNVLRHIGREVGAAKVLEQKILICHSGGDGKRIPQYSVCGKLFAPVQRQLENGRQSTIFDELMILSASIPARVGAGMLVMPSDTLILFNPVQLDLFSCDAAGLSMKADISVGREHGVFVADERDQVTRFLHKRSDDVLRATGAVDADATVNVDTGCVWFGARMVESLIDLISENGAFSDILFQKYVNAKTCLNFYGDFLPPLAREATLEDYLGEAPENVLSEELLACRREIWTALRKHRLSLAKLRPAEYIHFGTQKEFFDLVVRRIDAYSYLGWRRQIHCSVDTEASVSNSLIDPEIGLPSDCYIENSEIRRGCVVGGNSVLSGVTAENLRVPDNIFMHCVKLMNGKYVCRILGVDDNPKDSIFDGFLANPQGNAFPKAQLPADWIRGDSDSIWEAKLYPECPDPESAAESALLLWKMINGEASDIETASWKNAKRHSLKSSFTEADPQALLEWNELLGCRISVRAFVHALRDGAALADALSEFAYRGNSDVRARMLLEEADAARFPLNMRLYHALSVICQKHNQSLDGRGFDEFEDLAYGAVKDVIVPLVFERHGFLPSRFIGEVETVELPVRVNFCGSPSDAAPYCLEHGGTMFDGALLLSGRRPIRAEASRLEKPVVFFESVDLHARREFTSIREIRECGDPYDVFALHKAVLVSTGVISAEDDGVSLEAVLTRLGGGLRLATFADVPKGSGLGTSSIVAAACLKALNAILGQDTSDERIYAQVFAAEQLMNTGGGWQDQAGGLTPGLKLISTEPGVYQKINIQVVRLKQEIMNELNERFALIFSGQRRLARNVLREELNRCIENDPGTHQALERIRSLCVLMKFELERGNITRFAQYITEQFELVKTIDKGASNTYIEYIFAACKDLIDGKAICGAGGGGFLQVVLKRGVSKAMLRERLESVFKDCGVQLWDCELI